MRGWLGLGWVALATACNMTPETQISLAKPARASLLNKLALSARVVVKDAAGATVAASTLTTNATSAQGTVPELPAGRDLTIEVLWGSGGVVVARTVPHEVRLENEQSSAVAFSGDDYTYPDDDGDGAINLYELVWAQDNPNIGEPVFDNSIGPAGFFDSVVSVAATGGTTSTALAVEPVVNLFAVGAAEIDTSTNSPGPCFDHRISIIRLPTRQRTERKLNCAGTSLVHAVALSPINPAVGAAACLGSVHFFSPTDYLATGPYASNTTVGATQLVFTNTGEALYAVDALSGSVAVFGDGSGGSESLVKAQLTAHFFGAGSGVRAMAEHGRYLLFADGALGALHVVGHTSHRSHVLVETLFAGRIDDASAIAVHPDGSEIYVATGVAGSVSFIEARSANPQNWSLTRAVNVAPNLGWLAVEPVYGIWLYATAPKTLARIDTFTGTIDWRHDVPQDYSGGFQGLAISRDGTLGGVLGAAAALFQLGLGAGGAMEVEPNHQRPASTIGPPPSIAVGWGDISENTTDALTFDSHVYADNTASPIAFTEDIEDLWSLDTTGVTSAIAVAVLPTSSIARFGIVLFDDHRQPLAVEMESLMPLPLATGTGVFLLTPPATSIPAGSVVGVAIKDFDRISNFSPYEIVAVEIPTKLPQILDTEPNNDYHSAGRVMQFPSVIHGIADTADVGAYNAWGSEDVEDCFLLHVGNGRIGVRLEFDDTVDLDLTVHDATGTRIPGSVGTIGLGVAEYHVFEPYPTAAAYLVCVTGEDAAQPVPAPYTLTMIDFDISD